MTQVQEMQGETMQARRVAGHELRLLRLRDFATKGELTRPITIGAALKLLAEIPAADIHERRRADVLGATETIKGTFFLSPDGSKVYGLKPTTRVIDGRKVSMLSIKSVTPVISIITWEAK